ncbi:MAG: hypothetical protein ABL911_11460 [Gallionella sp.]
MTTLTTWSGRKDANNILFVTEIQDLLLSGCNLHKTPIAAKPMKGRIWTLTLETAKDRFLEQFDFLTR